MCQTNTSSGVQEFYDCLKKWTFSREEIIFESSLSDREIKIEWNDLVQNFDFGKCQTAIIKGKIDSPQNYLVLYLNSSLKYRIFLHDPKVFLMSVNSKAFHRTEIIVPQRSLSQLIDVTKYKLFSRDNSQCEQDESYNFSGCIQQKLANMVGCKVGGIPISKKIFFILLLSAF